MKKLMFVIAVSTLMIPALGLMSPAYAQFDSDVQDLTNILNGAQGGNRGNNRAPVIPTSKEKYDEIVKTLKDGKTPLDMKTQKKPLENLLDTEIVWLTDRLQLLKNNNNNANQNNQNAPGNFEGGRGRGGRGGEGNQPANNAQNNQQPNATELKVETITSLKNEDFLATKLSLFLTPEQTALVQKARAEDKANSNCLGGLLDRYYQQMQNPNRGNANQNFNNNNNNNNQTRPGTSFKYCMTIQSTESDRLEPIRKVLAKGNLPLAKDKDAFGVIVMKAELKDLEDSLRSGLTSNNNNQGGRGGNQNQNNANNRNNNPQQIIQTFNDGLYKKVEAILNPNQAATIKTWHYTQMLGRTPIESLIAVNAMQDTPLSDDQITKITAAWPEIRKQFQDAAKTAGKNLDAKTLDGAAMGKILEMLEPSQVASYQLAKKYGPEAAASGR